jgi:hypothetical protein
MPVHQTNYLTLGRLPVYDVRKYGATGDGTTDDATAVNAAGSAAASAGGVVHFPPGTYVVGARVELRTNVAFRGSGVGVTTIKLAASTAAAAMGCGSAVTDCVVEDLTIDGNKANQSSSSAVGVSASLCTRLTVRNVRVKDTYGRGVTLFQCTDSVVRACHFDSTGSAQTTNGTGASIQFLACTRCSAVDNYVASANDCGIMLGNTGSNVGAKVIGNTVRATYYIGIAGGTGNADATFNDNKVIDCTGNGIDVGNVAGCAVNGNTVEGCGGGIIGDGASNVVCCGNSVIATTSTGSRDGIHFVYSSTIKDINLRGNNVSGSYRHGISLQNVVNGSVGGNVVKNSGTGEAGNGIHLIDCTDITLPGNRSYDDQGTKTQGYGLRSTGTSDYLNVTGGNYRGNLTSSVTLVGSNNVNANNVT